MSRSKGDSSAVRPSNSWPSAAGSTTHSPTVPSTSAGSPLHLFVVPLACDADHLGPRDSQPAHSALGLDPARFRERDSLHPRVHTLGEIPQPLPADAAGDRDLASGVEELEHLRDVAVAGPAARLPRNDARVRHVARHQRPGLPQPAKHVLAEGVVLLEPLLGHRPWRRRVPLVVLRVRPCRHRLEVEREVGRRADVRTHLVERSILLECLRQLLGPIRTAHPRPDDEVGARRDRGGRVELEEGQVAHDLEQVGRPRRIEQLGADRDPPRLFPGQAMDRHAAQRYGFLGERSSESDSRDRWTRTSIASAR